MLLNMYARETCTCIWMLLATLSVISEKTGNIPIIQWQEINEFWCILFIQWSNIQQWKSVNSNYTHGWISEHSFEWKAIPRRLRLYDTTSRSSKPNQIKQYAAHGEKCKTQADGYRDEMGKHMTYR